MAAGAKSVAAIESFAINLGPHVVFVNTDLEIGGGPPHLSSVVSVGN